ncbi:MAG: hypothetical protein FWE65_00980 [Eggerthellaceae bacterium]|nr:hypothetical protein [Eggerthellaceae bacterium]
MIKMQIKMDEKKIKSDGRYNLAKIHGALDNYFVNTLRFTKGSDGFYLGNGSPNDYGNFGIAMVTLGKKQWFMDNVETWLYFNSNNSSNPNDFEVEDFKEYCQQRYHEKVV